MKNMTTIEILKERGHLLVPINDKRLLIDTGSPASMSPEPFEFIGAQHNPPASIMGISPRKMSELSGIQIDGMIGCDILSQHTMRIRWQDGEIDLGDNIPDFGNSHELTTLQGIPVFPVVIHEQSTKALFDTGAHLSYIDPNLVAGQESTGARDDFYPFTGPFTAETHIVKTALDETPLDIEYGILPASLQQTLGMAMNISNSSAVIGTQLLDFYDCTISWSRKAISWERK
jgi:hypothetical protein